MCQRLNTGESYNFYFGIFMYCGPLLPTYFVIVIWKLSKGDTYYNRLFGVGCQVG